MKIKTDKSMKDFSYIVSVITDVATDDSFLLQGSSGSSLASLIAIPEVLYQKLHNMIVSCQTWAKISPIGDYRAQMVVKAEISLMHSSRVTFTRKQEINNNKRVACNKYRGVCVPGFFKYFNARNS